MAATMKDIAAKTGLGLATISKYINGGKVKEKNGIAIAQAIKELDFTVNEIARGLKTSHTKTIGVIIPEFTNIFCMSIVSVIEDILRKNGYGLIVCDCRSDAKIEAETVSFLLKKKVDGIINMPVTNDGSHLLPAKALSIPIVLIDRQIVNLECDSVLIDNVEAASNAINVFIGNGHTHIAIICGPQDIFTSQQRLFGYHQSLLQNGIMPNEAYIAYGNNTIQSGFEAMKRLVQNKNEITALFVTNYEMTLGVIIALNELGLVIPDDFSVIGFDNQELAMVVQPKLTVISQPIQEIGKEAANLLLGRLTDKENAQPQTINLKTTLIKGDSVKRIII
jgi:LacI family transcriptional regulator